MHDIPREWLGDKIEVNDIHMHYQTLCLNINKRGVYIDGEQRPLNMECKLGSGSPFKHELVSGYKIYRYSTPEDYWKSFSGHKGFALEIDSKIVETIVTTVQ